MALKKKECLTVYIGLSGIVFLDQIELNMIDISSDTHSVIFLSVRRKKQIWYENGRSRA